MLWGMCVCVFEWLKQSLHISLCSEELFPWTCNLVPASPESSLWLTLALHLRTCPGWGAWLLRMSVPTLWKRPSKPDVHNSKNNIWFYSFPISLSQRHWQNSEPDVLREWSLFCHVCFFFSGCPFFAGPTLFDFSINQRIKVICL